MDDEKLALANSLKDRIDGLRCNIERIERMLGMTIPGDTFVSAVVSASIGQDWQDPVVADSMAQYGRYGPSKKGYVAALVIILDDMRAQLSDVSAHYAAL